MIDALPLLLGPEGYQISRSVRLRSSASAYLNRTNGTPTSGTTWTISFWIKRGSNLGTQQNIMGAGQTSGTNYFQITFDAANTLTISDNPAGNTLITTQVFRDPSAWYHIVYAVDTTQATASNRTKLYVNGTQVTAFSTATYPSLNAVGYWNTNAYVRAIGNIWYNGAPGGFYFDGYLTEVNFIDGQALTPSSFGETNVTTGVWQPKKYAGTYGTNGFYLNFSDNSAATAAAIGKDYSGNGNNWTPNNISVTAGVTYDSMLDVPTQWADGGNGRGNYATWNPIARLTSANTNGQRWEEGNLKLYPSGSEGAVNTTSLATIAIPASGKWYWEVTPTIVATAASSRTAIGIMSRASSFASGLDFYYSTVAGAYAYAANGQKINSPTPTFAAYGASYTANDVIGVAVDADAGTLTFYKNGTSQGTAFSGLDMTSEFFPAAGYWGTFQANFGQRPFAYTPPSGFKALNTLNLPTPTILKGNQYFDATLWTGNGGSQTIANSGGMQPDFAWVKKRNGAENHELTDAVRGANLRLASNSTGAESAGGIAFNSTGLSLTGGYGTDNENGQTYVGWQWKEGATQGFDIVTYTGTGVNRTVAHNLGVAPSFMIVKARSSAGYDWRCYHSALGATKYIDLQTTSAAGTASTVWQDTAPTSSVFSVGTNGSVNANTVTFVAYLFSQITGFSAFGSYTGNGSTDGTFVFTGFRPAFILVKASSNSTASTVWTIWDTRRSPSNAAVLELFPNSSIAEFTDTNGIDILSNGFKPRRNSEYANFSGWTYIYAAFAENPLKFSLAR